MVKYAPVAQLDRALAYGASCWRFDSSQAHFMRMVRQLGIPSCRKRGTELVVGGSTTPGRTKFCEEELNR